jgi:hypothetical protein
MIDYQNILQDLEGHFNKHGWEWSIKGKGTIAPQSEDFMAALDEAVRVLYSEGDQGGNMIQIGRLIIIRQGDTFDVYVLAGTFQGEK